MQQLVYKHTLANGLTILGEPMPWLESVAFTLMTPLPLLIASTFVGA